MNMKMMKFLLSLILFLTGITIQALAQGNASEEEKNFGVTIKGFVKNDFFWDSRQTVAAREGHFLLWPSPVQEDPDGNDINGNGSFNFLAIQSRLSFAITGPDALGAKTSGLIEGDFFAQANDNINLLRLRHAFIKLNWERLEIMAGQFWNPLFVTGCFPGTVSFNTGTPLQSFARNPQLRATYKVGGLSLVGAALSQRDFANVGAPGTSSHLRNSSTPDLHFQVHYGTKNGEGPNILAGAGMAYKTIAPRISSTVLGQSYAVRERVGGLTLMGFARLNTKPLTFKLQGRYGENISDLLSISGYGITAITDLLTGEQAYTPLKNMTFWGEVHTNGNPQVGLFGGYTRNLGSKDPLLMAFGDPAGVYGRAIDIHSLFRISPRIIYNAGDLRVALELEYTSAAYGSGWDENYIPGATIAADNLRVLAAVYYFF